MTDRPVRAFDVRTDVAGESTLLVRGMDCFEIDEVGTIVWTSADGNHTIPEIAAKVSEVFEVDASQAEADVAAFVADLRKTGLLE